MGRLEGEVREKASGELMPAQVCVRQADGRFIHPEEAILKVGPGHPWTDLPKIGWYPGNTHVHYKETEADPDSRLRMDPRIHDLRLTVISILERNGIPYASNKYPVGLLNEFSSAHHLVDCGEESRHNTDTWEIGYGHIMLIRLKEPVDPLSRGLLVSQRHRDGSSGSRLSGKAGSHEPIRSLLDGARI